MGREARILRVTPGYGVMLACFQNKREKQTGSTGPARAGSAVPGPYCHAQHNLFRRKHAINSGWDKSQSDA